MKMRTETTERPLGVYDYDGLSAKQKEKIKELLREDAERGFTKGQRLPDGD